MEESVSIIKSLQFCSSITRCNLEPNTYFLNEIADRDFIGGLGLGEQIDKGKPLEDQQKKEVSNLLYPIKEVEKMESPSVNEKQNMFISEQIEQTPVLPSKQNVQNLESKGSILDQKYKMRSNLSHIGDEQRPQAQSKIPEDKFTRRESALTSQLNHSIQTENLSRNNENYGQRYNDFHKNLMSNIQIEPILEKDKLESPQTEEKSQIVRKSSEEELILKNRAIQKEVINKEVENFLRDYQPPQSKLTTASKNIASNEPRYFEQTENSRSRQHKKLYEEKPGTWAVPRFGTVKKEKHYIVNQPQKHRELNLVKEILAQEQMEKARMERENLFSSRKKSPKLQTKNILDLYEDIRTQKTKKNHKKTVPKVAGPEVIKLDLKNTPKKHKSPKDTSKQYTDRSKKIKIDFESLNEKIQRDLLDSSMKSRFH